MERVVSYETALTMVEEELIQMNIALDIHIDNINKSIEGGR